MELELRTDEIIGIIGSCDAVMISEASPSLNGRNEYRFQ